MKIDSKLFDKIRVRRDKETVAKESQPPCEWDGCDRAGPHRAPKGRGAEGQFFHFCVDHARAYNLSYNYFAGLPDDAVEAFRKDALTGNRPTWKMGVDPNTREAFRTRGAGFTQKPMNDPFDLFPGAANRAEPETVVRRRKLKALEKRSFDALALDETADAVAIKAQYKLLVKRHHPDANGGDRSSEDRLREIIQAYNYLKNAGFC